jgi:hypothetical protein
VERIGTSKFPRSSTADQRLDAGQDRDSGYWCDSAFSLVEFSSEQCAVRRLLHPTGKMEPRKALAAPLLPDVQGHADSILTGSASSSASRRLTRAEDARVLGIGDFSGCLVASWKARRQGRSRGSPPWGLLRTVARVWAGRFPAVPTPRGLPANTGSPWRLGVVASGGDREGHRGWNLVRLVEVWKTSDLWRLWLRPGDAQREIRLPWSPPAVQEH